MLCDGCGAVGATQKCANCHKTWYCNKECQKAHWKLVHKKICGVTEAGALWSCGKSDVDKALTHEVLRAYKTVLLTPPKICDKYDVDKTLALVFAKLGLPQPIANPLGSMRPGTEQWEQLSSREQGKAVGRFEQMFKGFEKAENRSDYDAAVQSMARRYPVCAAEDCEKTSRFRCETCLSDTEKYCSIECQGADYSRHKHKCVQDTVGAATHASKE